MMKNRKFTNRETTLLLLLCLLLLVMFYYLILYRPVHLEVERCENERVMVEENLDIQMVKAARKRKMEEELKSAPDKMQGELLPYNNIKMEITDLYDALYPASTYSLSFSEAAASGNIVRRDISISFQADSYRKVYVILNRMHNSPYRCIIKDLSLSADKSRGEAGGMSDGKLITVNTTVTFYETLTGAENTNGLVFEKQQLETDTQNEEQE